MKIDSIDKTNGTDKDYYLLVIDGQGNIQFANSYLVTNLDLHIKKIYKNSFFDLLDTSHQKSFRDILGRVKEFNTTQTIEVSILNGTHHWIKWEISCYKNETDDTDKYFCLGYDIVGKKRVNRMRQVTQNNYQAILEGLTIGVILQDSNGEILTVNQKAAEIFDTSIEEIHEINGFKDLWKTITSENGPLSFEDSPPMKALQTGTIQNNVKIDYKNRKGELRSLLVSSNPLFDMAGSAPVSVVSSFIDQTREKKLESTIHQQEILFQTFQNNTPNLSWIVDDEDRLIYGNKSFFKYLGIHEASVGKNILGLLPEPIADVLEIKHRQVMESGMPLKTYEKLFLADGTMMAFWINLFPIDSVSGKKMIGGEAINITDRFKSEEKLQQINERLRYLTQFTADAIWEWDMHTGKIFSNKILQELLGYSIRASQNLGWWFRRIHAEDRKKLRDTIKKVIGEKSQSWESEYRFKKASGEFISVYDRGYIIYENELPVKMIGSFQDITQLKELEAKLVEEKMQHQKDITEIIFAVQEKERTRIGHELHDNVNQILGASKTFVEMIKTLDTESLHIKEKVSGYILSAIEEIRRLSKEMVTPQLKENGLIESIKRLVEDLRDTNLMNVSFNYHDEIEIISNGKKVTLFRIVQEQLKNTVKYSKAENLCINLQADTNNVVLIIEDDGIGFDPGQTRRGIGLSNIYERTRFYNGTVQIITAPEQGCRLTVSIPLLY